MRWVAFWWRAATARIDLTASQRHRLQAELHKARRAGYYRRLLAIPEPDRGKSVAEAAVLPGVTRQSVYNWAHLYEESPTGRMPSAYCSGRSTSRPDTGSSWPVDGSGLRTARPFWKRSPGATAAGTWRCCSTKTSSHTAKSSQALADRLGLELLWPPKRSPRLNPMDHLWRHGKQVMLANHQYETLDAQVERFIAYLTSLSATEALRKAGILSEKFWLK